jgi:PST family polysaccharide transporter
VGLFWRELGAWAIAVPFLALLYPISLRRLQDFYRMAMLRRKGANDTRAA